MPDQKDRNVTCPSCGYEPDPITADNHTEFVHGKEKEGAEAIYCRCCGAKYVLNPNPGGENTVAPWSAP